MRDTKEYIETFLVIRTKDGRLTCLSLNAAQERLHRVLTEMYLAGKPMRVIILKARQLGFSTYVEAVIFKRTATKRNVKSLVVAHREDSTANLFQMTKRFLANLPPEIRPMTASSNAQEIVFENPDKDLRRKALNPGLDSRIRCNTAGGAGIGRSDTLQNVHASEFAYWRGNKKDTFAGIAQAVPALPDTLIVIESTANGFDEFKDMWDAAVVGDNDYIPLFFPWFDNPEYTMEPPEEAEFAPEERELQERFGLTDGQLWWRRWCIKNNCAGDERVFRQEYPATPDEAFLTSGDGFFDNEMVMALRERAPEPIRTGEFKYDFDGESITNIRWVDRPKGRIRIFREPKKRRPYVLGGDTAGEGSDWFSAFVVDNVTGRWCAVLHQQKGEPEYTRQVYCLGMYYNGALIGLECNFSTYPMTRLSEYGYDKLYVREVPDKFTGELQKSFGYVTNGKTRPKMLAELGELFEEQPELFEDFETLGEMLTFAYNEDGRPEALPGKNDDLVMGLAVTWAIRGQQSTVEGAAGFSMEGWTPDMVEDYERAGEAERAYLRKAWGKAVDESED